MLPIRDYIRRPSNLFSSLIRRYGGCLPDKIYLQAYYRLKMGRRLELDNPIRYNDKLQWLKLFYHRPEFTSFVDKSLVKNHVKDVIGEQFVIPTLGIWDTAEEIDWGSLPNRFVLKCTNAGGNYGVVICKDKQLFDKEAAIRKLNIGASLDLYQSSREWPYKNIKPRIIAEEYKEDALTGELRDYKFFCFNGVVKALFVGTERQKPGEDVKFDFFDENYTHLPVKQRHEHAAQIPAKPVSFEQMKEIASKLSIGIPHVRIDLYEVDGQPFFGEMTFYHFGGMVPFEPDDWDFKFGEWLTLPEKIF